MLHRALECFYIFDSLTHNDDAVCRRRRHYHKGAFPLQSVHIEPSRFRGIALFQRFNAIRQIKRYRACRLAAVLRIEAHQERNTPAVSLGPIAFGQRRKRRSV